MSAAPDEAGQAPPAAPSEQALRLAEALLFAAEKPVTRARLQEALPEGEDAARVLAALVERYAGRGVEIVEVAGGVAFRTAPDLAPMLTRVIETPRRLSRAALEALAVIAWHQPVTRPEIEEIRGAALAQTTLETLLEAGLVAPRGRKEVPGRPTLWGTTPKFLEQFGLRSLNDLPKREELLAERPAPLAPPAGEGAAGGAPAPAEAAETAGTDAEGSDAGAPNAAGAPPGPGAAPPREGAP
ncbi:MAG: SMC-Scp complex subunit ScpB [Acetobacteraceae bacterium]|nr:SMC-Scp complex subunit ScpB [Acetobacteraceae bacterium]